MVKDKNPPIIAHRGNCDGLPENTMAAFKRSIVYKVDGIETDVQLTKDNIPVIFHDNISSRLTGSKKRIFSYTLDELLKFDIKNEKILTLEQTIKELISQTSLYIEIKSDALARASNRSHLLTHKVLEQVLNLDSEFQQKIFILSFDPDVLKLAYNISHTIKCVLNLNGSEKWCINAEDILNKKIDFSFLSGLCINLKKITPKLVNFAHMNKMKMFTYSCNTEQQLKKLLGMNLDGIMTDKAQWLPKRIKYEKRN